MTKLGLASPEFSKSLSYRHALDTTLKKCIELCGTSRKFLDVLALFKNLHTSAEALTLNFLSDFVALVSFSLCDTFDVEHIFLRAVSEKVLKCVK